MRTAEPVLPDCPPFQPTPIPLRKGVPDQTAARSPSVGHLDGSRGSATQVSTLAFLALRLKAPLIYAISGAKTAPFLAGLHVLSHSFLRMSCRITPVAVYTASPAVPFHRRIYHAHRYGPPPLHPSPYIPRAKQCGLPCFTPSLP